MNNATDIAAHIVDPCRPAKTMCGKPSDGASPDWQTAAATCKRCARGAATLRRMGPDLVSYWAGSVGSSVVNAFDRGDCVTVYVGDGEPATCPHRQDRPPRGRPRSRRARRDRPRRPPDRRQGVGRGGRANVRGVDQPHQGTP